MKCDERILPSSPAWEVVCQQCGLCCLVKYIDEYGDFYLTRVACDNLDLQTKKCKCYDSKVENRGDLKTGCAAHNGRRLDYETLHNDYLVPACCPYVKRFVGPNRMKQPNLSGVDLIYESDIDGTLHDYILADSWRLFKYNPHVNKAAKEALQKIK